MLNDVDIVDELLEDARIVVFYHYNCEDCQVVLPLYSQYSEQFVTDDTIKFAFISGPPYASEGQEIIPENTTALVGKLLDDEDNWVFESPLIFLLIDGQLTAGWQVEYPDLDELLTAMTIQ